MWLLRPSSLGSPQKAFQLQHAKSSESRSFFERPWQFPTADKLRSRSDVSLYCRPFYSSEGFVNERLHKRPLRGTARGDRKLEHPDVIQPNVQHVTVTFGLHASSTKYGSDAGGSDGNSLFFPPGPLCLPCSDGEAYVSANVLALRGQLTTVGTSFMLAHRSLSRLSSLLLDSGSIQV